MRSNKKVIRFFFYTLCCLILVWISSFRTSPYYGKLDFLFVDSKPWWPVWKPMVESAMKRGNSQPILSDPVTSTIMRGVFAQKTVYSRVHVKNRPLFIDSLDRMNTSFNHERILPTGALVLLLGDNIDEKNGILGVVTNYNLRKSERGKREPVGYSPDQKYRCIINLKGFDPTWVPAETKHWSTRKADTKWFYRYPSTHVRDMQSVLTSNPPKNCEVFD